MKKILPIILVVLSLLFSACGKEASRDSEPETTHIHEFSEWIVEKNATCSDEGLKERVCACGEKETETIPATGKHNYVGKVTKEATVTEEGIKTYTCSVCGAQYEETIEKVPGNWEILYYQDEFGDWTSDAFVVGTFYGKFSNSVTSGSDLTVYVYLDKSSKYVYFKLIEYGTYKASALSSEYCQIKLKETDGSTETIKLIYLSANGSFFSDDSKLKSMILNNENLSCLITISSNQREASYGSYNESYTFKIDNAGLQELYDQT